MAPDSIFNIWTFDFSPTKMEINNNKINIQNNILKKEKKIALQVWQQQVTVRLNLHETEMTSGGKKKGKQYPE